MLTRGTRLLYVTLLSLVTAPGVACAAVSPPEQPSARVEDSTGFEPWLLEQCPIGQTLHLVDIETGDLINDVSCEDVHAMVRTDAGVRERVLDAYWAQRVAPDAVCDDVDLKGFGNFGTIWGIGCGWVAGSALGGALAGPIGAGVGGAIGGYIGAHDPWLQ